MPLSIMFMRNDWTLPLCRTDVHMQCTHSTKLCWKVLRLYFIGFLLLTNAFYACHKAKHSSEA